MLKKRSSLKTSGILAWEGPTTSSLSFVFASHSFLFHDLQFWFYLPVESLAWGKQAKSLTDSSVKEQRSFKILNLWFWCYLHVLLWWVFCLIIDRIIRANSADTQTPGKLSALKRMGSCWRCHVEGENSATRVSQPRLISPSSRTMLVALAFTFPNFICP